MQISYLSYVDDVYFHLTVPRFSFFLSLNLGKLKTRFRDLWASPIFTKSVSGIIVGLFNQDFGLDEFCLYELEMDKWSIHFLLVKVFGQKRPESCIGSRMVDILCPQS